MDDNWIKFSDELPTEENGEQVQILFGHPKWAIYIRGLYTHFPDEDIKARIWEYIPDKDKYQDWNSMMPTHWIKLPNNPK